MSILIFCIAILMQETPPAAARVVVGLVDGQQIVVENPVFAGFIEGRGDGAVLVYRRPNYHGEMPAKLISKVEFREYRRGQPLSVTVTLRNGQTLEVQSERKDYLTINGKTDVGNIRINHPDPVSAPLRITTEKPDRTKDFTILYLEFPAS